MVSDVGVLFCGQDEGHDEAVKPQHLGEDQDQDHAHEEPRLLGGAPHAGVAHDSDGEPGCQAAQAHTQTSAKVHETPAEEKKCERLIRNSARLSCAGHRC